MAKRAERRWKKGCVDIPWQQNQSSEVRLPDRPRHLHLLLPHPPHHLLKVKTVTSKKIMTASSNAQFRLATVSGHLASSAADPVSSALETSLPPVQINRDALSVLLDGEDQTWRNWVSRFSFLPLSLAKRFSKREEKNIDSIGGNSRVYNRRCLSN